MDWETKMCYHINYDHIEITLSFFDPSILAQFATKTPIMSTMKIKLFNVHVTFKTFFSTIECYLQDVLNMKMIAWRDETLSLTLFQRTNKGYVSHNVLE